MNFNVKNLLPNNGEAYFITQLLGPTQARAWYDQLERGIQWQARKIKIFGREVMQPRLMAWYGADGANYKYSGTLFEPQSWKPEILRLKALVEEATGESYNSALFNLYRDQNDSMGAHRDNEKELGTEPTIASLSLGAQRPFIFRHIINRDKIRLELLPGSLLVMRGETQSFWKHELPKLNKPIGSRINVTFRKIIPTGKVTAG